MPYALPRIPLRHRRRAGLLAAALALALVADAARAQTGAPAQPAAPATQPAPPVDPTFSAYALAQRCQQVDDNVAHGQCVGAVRGIIHGYEYGVLMLSQRVSLPPAETQRVSLCLREVPVATLVDEFVKDANQVDAEALKRTPAEVAVLGSVHLHHGCN